MDSILRQCIIGIAIGSLTSSISGQEIFKAKWKGIAVQNFYTDNKPIIKFTARNDGDTMYLRAHTDANSQDIVKACWKGVGFQDFLIPAGDSLKGFEAESAEGWVYLKAITTGDSTKEILRTKLKGTAVRGCTFLPGDTFRGFTVDTVGEWVILKVEIGCVGIEEPNAKSDELFSSLSPIAPNPSLGYPNVSYSIAKPVRVSLVVYDCSGRVAKTLVEDSQKQGKYQLIWNNRDNLGKLEILCVPFYVGLPTYYYSKVYDQDETYSGQIWVWSGLPITPTVLSSQNGIVVLSG